MLEVECHGQNNRAGLFNGACKRVVIGLRLGKDDVECDYGGIGLVQTLNQACQDITTPGPAPQPFQAFFIDGGNDNRVRGRDCAAQLEAQVVQFCFDQVEGDRWVEQEQAECRGCDKTDGYAYQL